MNNHDIYPQDLYILNYYGVKIIFQVCKTYPESVFIIELEQKRYKNGLTLTKRLKPAKNPLIVKGTNRFSTSKFEVKTRKDKKLEIKVNTSTELFWYVAKRNDAFPKMGTFLAEPFEDFRNKFWKNSKSCKKSIDIDKYIN